MSIKKDILWRIYVAFFAVCCLGFTIVYKAVHIQFGEGPKLVARSDSATIAYKPIDAERGNILSEDGRLLATALPYFEVRMDVSALGLSDDVFNDKVDSLAWRMSNFFKNKSVQSYKQELVTARKQGLHNFLISKNASYPDMQEIKSWPILNLGRYKGGLLTWSFSHRVLPFRGLAKRTIGYIRDSVQPVGLEGSFDDYLSGVKGKRLMQKIAGDTWIPVNDEDEIHSENGRDIVTTIDVNLQDVLENALRKALILHNAEHGCAILMEVSTGKIKAIANLGKEGEGDYEEVMNYGIGELNEPGSTFKLATAISLLEDGYVNTTDSVDIEGSKAVFCEKTTMHDSEEHHLKKVTVKHAFEISSNVAFAKLIDKYYRSQPDKFIHHLLDLGIYNKTGIEIKGETDPYSLQPGQPGWSCPTLPQLAVGYGIQLTPLQILSFYNAVANNGYRVKPYLVEEAQKQGKVVKAWKPEVSGKRICSEEVLKKLKSMMEGVVSDTGGTAKNLKNPYYKIAGKTGTAQVNINGIYTDTLHRASFVGYFPADKPAYSCIVVIHKPRVHGYYGGVVAAPVFKEIADKVYSTSLELHARDNNNKDYVKGHLPDLKSGDRNDAQEICKALGITATPQNEAPWVSSQTKTDGVALKERAMDDGMVPNVLGMGLKDALFLLENQGLIVEFKGKGKVKQQSVQPGAKALRGQPIIIELG